MRSDDKTASTAGSADLALRESLIEALGVERAQVMAFTDETPLFGALPELDSMAVATLLTDLEDRLGIVIEDDEIDAGIFESFGDLRAYLAGKLAGA